MTKNEMPSILYGILIFFVKSVERFIKPHASLRKDLDKGSEMV